MQVQAARTLYVDVSGITSDLTGPSVGISLYCTMFCPPSSPKQTITITSYSVTYPSYGSTNRFLDNSLSDVNSMTNVVATNIMIASGQSYGFTMSGSASNGVTGLMQLPRAFKVEVTESHGFLTGNCTYFRTNVGQYYFSTSLPINGGRPF